MFLREDLALKIIMDCRTVKKNLGFNLLDVINTKEQAVLEGENMQTQYYVLDDRIDLYSHDYKLAKEVDEFGHSDRKDKIEIERQKAIEK